MGKSAIAVGICCLFVSANSLMATPPSVSDNAVTTGGLLVPAQPQTPKPLRTFPSKAILTRGVGISFEDYPLAAMRNNESGIVYFSMVIGPDGLPKSCSVTKSSGSAILDSETCRISMRRARFDPALDDKGTPIEGSYSTKVGWKTYPTQ